MESNKMHALHSNEINVESDHLMKVVRKYGLKYRLNPNKLMRRDTSNKEEVLRLKAAGKTENASKRKRSVLAEESDNEKPSERGKKRLKKN